MDLPGDALSACDGVVASVALPKLVQTSAPASTTAAVSATTRRIFRLRAGSTDASIMATPGRVAGGSAGRAAPGPLARVPRPGPGREDQHDAGVRGGPHLVALVRVEDRQVAGPRLLLGAALGHLDLAVGHQEVRPLVHLVVVELLAGRQVDRDHASLAVGAQHLRLVDLDVQRTDVPAFQVVPPESYAGGAGNYWIAGRSTSNHITVRSLPDSVPQRLESWSTMNSPQPRSSPSVGRPGSKFPPGSITSTRSASSPSAIASSSSPPASSSGCCTALVTSSLRQSDAS